VFGTVVIRGTDIEADSNGLLVQLIEDLDAVVLVDLPYTAPPTNPSQNPNGTVLIAAGSADGFKILTALTDSSGNNLVGALDTFLTQNPGAPLVVTGHSLGACQASLMAPYLLAQFPSATIVPNTFAAPTAGNAAFRWMYENVFPYSPRWYNTYDLIPMAYSEMTEMQTLWQQCGVLPSVLESVAIKAMAAAVGSVYQQAGIPAAALPGACAIGSPTGSPTWTEELKDQHFIFAPSDSSYGYWSLVSSYNPAPLPLPQPPHQLAAPKP
jgi:lipase (class 3)